MSATARPSWAPAATTALAVATCLVFAADIALTVTMPATVPALDFTPLAAYAPIVPFTLLAAISLLLVHRQPRNAVAWLLASIALLFAGSNIGTLYLQHWLYSPDLPAALVAPLGLLGVGFGAMTGLPLAILPLVFPDGRPLSRRWGLLLWAAAVLAVANVIGLADPAALGDGHRQVANPLGVPGMRDILNAADGVDSIGWFLLIILGLVSLVLRFRHADADQRQQIKWFGAGLAILTVCILGGILTATTPSWTTPAPIAFEMIGFTAVPVCVAVAVLKYRLYDIDLIVSRALVYGALAALITAVYVAVVVGIGAFLGAGGKPNLALSIVATAIVAVGFQPVRERLQRLANRLVFGRRATPYEVLSDFSGRVAGTYSADEVLPQMAAVLARGTGAVKAAVWLRAGQQMRVAAAYPPGAADGAVIPVAGQLLPALPDALRAVAVRHQGELLGAVAVQKRAGETLTPIEETLLVDLAGQAGLVLKNVGLTADLEARLRDLQASRQRLLRAQDEERRRLEHVLSDGAQRNLASLKEGLRAARTVVRSAPDQARTMLQQLKAETDQTLESLRDVARGIYPPLLAEKGLVVALEAQARKATVPVSVESMGVGRFTQEVEATAYFCCLEALQNVQRHAGRCRATIRLEATDDELTLEVEDDGAGFDAATTPHGAGLANMADRLDALGGNLSVRSSAGAGCTVRGSLPLVLAA